MKKDEIWWRPSLLMFARLSSWIVVPVLVGTFLGNWLDTKYGTEPWLFLASVGTAFAISLFGLIRNVLEEYKRIEKENKK